MAYHNSFNGPLLFDDLPAIRDNLGGGITGLHLVMDGYTLPFAALLLFAGTLSDRIGARRAFGTGLITFIVSSAACAFAPALWVLVAARFAGEGRPVRLIDNVALDAGRTGS